MCRIAPNDSVPRRKVLYVTPWYPTEENPAGGIFVQAQARAAARFDDVAVVHLVAGGMPGQRARLKLSEVDEAPNLVLRAGYRPPAHGARFLELAALHQSIRWLRRRGFQADLIHAQVVGAIIAAARYCRLARIPLVATEHSSVYLDEEPLTLSTVVERRMDRALRQAVWVLPVSSTLREAMTRVSPSAAYRVVPNVVDCQVFRPAPPVPTTHGFRLIAVGLLAPEKGYTTMLYAIRRLVDEHLAVRLEIIGYGVLADELKRRISDLDLEEHVRLSGYLPQLEIAERLRRAHLFVHASEYETFGVVIAEALASGLPVVCTRCGGPEDYIDASNGGLVPVNDPVALAAEIRGALARLDSFDRTKVAAAARRRFSADVVGRQLSEIYAAACPGF